MYLLGLLNSLGGYLIAGASENQINYITELSQQYIEYGENILDMFLHRNASTYLTMVAARHYGFDLWHQTDNGAICSVSSFIFDFSY